MPDEKRAAPVSPTELGLRFGLPVAGLGDLVGDGAAAGPKADAADALPLSIGFGMTDDPVADGLQVVPGQSGAEGVAELPGEGDRPAGR